jgi:hypothetical protein
MHRRLIIHFFFVVVGVCVAAPSFSADSGNTADWPCIQAKVPEISSSAVWDGALPDRVANHWNTDPKIAELVAKAAARRTPIEEAKKTLSDFLSGGDKEQRGAKLFAGLFETLNGQRSEILRGLERLARRVKALADQIRTDVAALQAMQQGAANDEARMNELQTQIEWNTRIFDERRKSIRYACEAPVNIEQRLFALSRVIQQALEP